MDMPTKPSSDDIQPGDGIMPTPYPTSLQLHDAAGCGPDIITTDYPSDSALPGPWDQFLDLYSANQAWFGLSQELSLMDPRPTPEMNIPSHQTAQCQWQQSPRGHDPIEGSVPRQGKHAGTAIDTFSQPRRRAQNRLAQQVYRQKQKNHVEFLVAEIARLEQEQQLKTIENEKLAKQIQRIEKENRALRTLQYTGSKSFSLQTVSKSIWYSPCSFLYSCEREDLDGVSPSRRGRTPSTGISLFDITALWDSITSHELVNSGVETSGRPPVSPVETLRNDKVANWANRRRQLEYKQTNVAAMMVNPPHKRQMGIARPHSQHPSASQQHHQHNSTHHPVGRGRTAHQPPHRTSAYQPTAASVIQKQPAVHHGMHMTKPTQTNQVVHAHAQKPARRAHVHPHEAGHHGQTSRPAHGHAPSSHVGSHNGNHPGHSSSHHPDMRAAAGGAVAGGALGGTVYYLYNEAEDPTYVEDDNVTWIDNNDRPVNDNTEDPSDYDYRYCGEDYTEDPNYGNISNAYNNFEDNGNEGNGLVGPGGFTEDTPRPDDNYSGRFGLGDNDGYSPANGGDSSDCCECNGCYHDLDFHLQIPPQTLIWEEETHRIEYYSAGGFQESCYSIYPKKDPMAGVARWLDESDKTAQLFKNNSFEDSRQDESTLNLFCFNTRD
ncbi:hypothetical protein FSARC_12653 [Fusarium sarcochroum]|uniref:BZIP domain-containing protein n=1 Tax=Fusarium sarcochroum TaxID=1208366 RepID=A0A8H4WWI1_9HYPO|nr:hypothetical protein FSARC_12653 [Fusarium sarcochroum]